MHKHRLSRACCSSTTHFWLRIVLPVVVCSASVSVAFDETEVLGLARAEGSVRTVIAACFSADAATHGELSDMSDRFIRTLSSAMAIPLAELEAEVAAGVADSSGDVPKLATRCESQRERLTDLFRRRDDELTSLGY